MANTRALVLLAEGAEEMETTISVDVLRRAGIEVTLAGIDGAQPVRCSRGVVLVPDCAFAEVQDEATFDVVVLPGGGGGAERLGKSAEVGSLLRARFAAERWVAAICAAPTALARHRVFSGYRMTCHPSVNDEVAGHGELTEGPVVRDRHLITSQGPGTSFAFALRIIAELLGAEAAEKVAAPMLVSWKAR